MGTVAAMVDITKPKIKKLLDLDYLVLLEIVRCTWLQTFYRFEIDINFKFKNR